MNDLKKFITDFIQNKGLLVFLSILVEKAVALVNTIVVVRLITDKDYGTITIIASIFAVFITLSGFGSVQGFMRYGALEKSKEAKDKLANYIFIQGFKRHLFLVMLFFSVAFFYELKYPSIWIVILFFGIRMIGSYFYSFILSYYRIHGKNNLFSIISIKINGIGLLITFLLTYFFGTYGYLTALALIPWLSLFYIDRNRFQRAIYKPLNVDLKSFWNYSFNSSITYFLSEMLFILDVFLIGFWLNESAVANYKVAIILPMNLMFIPMIFMQTDYPKLVENSFNKVYIKFYIRNYYKIFIPLSLCMLVGGFFLKDWILPFVFGQQYQGNGMIFFLILLAVATNMCFRNLYGNLLSAVGQAKKNTIVSFTSIVFMLALSFILIPIYGIRGAAIALTITFISTGVLSSIFFYNYLRKL